MCQLLGRRSACRVRVDAFRLRLRFTTNQLETLCFYSGETEKKEAVLKPSAFIPDD